VKKVLLMIHRLWQGGGTETHVRLLASQLVKAGWEVGLFTAGGPWVPSLRAKGVRVYIDDRADRERLASLKRLLALEKYQVVHAHDGSSFRLVAQLPRNCVKVTMTIHGDYMFKGALKTATRRADAVLVVSPELAQMARKARIEPRKIKEVANGICTHVFYPARVSDLRLRRGIEAGAFVIGYAGRFTYAKAELGKRVVEAFLPYLQQHREAQMLVAGRESGETLTVRNPRVRILGHVDDMASFYRACDVVIGTGRVALESAACGIPTIAVGEGRLIGRLLPDTLGQAAVSNFGDHGARMPWQAAELVTAVDEVRRQREASLRDASQVGARVRQKYSANQMVREIQQVYRNLA